MLKAECEVEGCRFIVRVAASQVANVGPPHCPKHGAMAVHPPPEHIFEDFAREIYCDHPTTPRFQLPTLYGGALDQRCEPVKKYKILFVLDQPSRTFTKSGWRQCDTPDAAIQRHRRIFLNWAYDDTQPPQRPLVHHLFRSLCGERPACDSDFYKQFYITDAWKDAVHDSNNGAAQQEYEDYWLLKLSIELNHVDTRRIIFVGKSAAYAGWRVGWRLIKNNHIPAPDFIPFPGGRWILSDKTRQSNFRKQVDHLRAQIQRVCDQ